MTPIPLTLSGPAEEWLREAPNTIRQLEREMLQARLVLCGAKDGGRNLSINPLMGASRLMTGAGPEPVGGRAVRRRVAYERTSRLLITATTPATCFAALTAASRSASEST